jgi:hypothetical protein
MHMDEKWKEFGGNMMWLVLSETIFASASSRFI